MAIPDELDGLFEELFKAKQSKNLKEIKNIRARINRRILNLKREEFEENSLEVFFTKMKDKRFYKNLSNFVKYRKDFSDIEIAKFISSMLTHSLIEMEKEGAKVFSELKILDQVETLNKFLSGELNAETVREIYFTGFGEYF